jgi:acyl-coenzyme A synthetase/AMP-(fatty) acid ligase
MQDEAGYYKILGRADDRINVNGYKLDPLSIENMLFEKLPNLEECAVFGINSVKCVYVGPYTKQQVKQVLCSINKHSNPKKLEKLQSIPKNTAGKISRTFLNQLF